MDTPALSRRRFLSTPRWLILYGAVTALLAIGTGTVVATTAAGVGTGFDTIGTRAAPQVQAASDLYFALSDLDAQAANVLLVGTDPALAAARTAALRTYDQRRTQADADLALVSGDSGGDATTRRDIAADLDDLGRYESLVTQSFTSNERGADPAGRPSTTTLASYRTATDAMRNILDRVRRLTDANQARLNTAYAGSRALIGTAQAWLGVLGGLLVAALVAAQAHLWRRLRRRTNPALAAATVVAVVLMVLGLGLLSHESTNLTVAKADAFDSVVALSRARSVSYDANADESRFLMDPERANQYQRAFLVTSKSLVDIAGPADVSFYDSFAGLALRNYENDPAEITFTGYFANEAHNITFAGERAAASRTLDRFEIYLSDDEHLRDLAANGNLTGAITFDIGTTPGSDDYDFSQYDRALVELIGINQRAFDSVVHDGRAELAGWTLPVPGVAALLVIAATGIGLWPRIREYR